MSLVNLTTDQARAYLHADNVLALLEIYLPLAARGHIVDLLHMASLALNARREMRQAFLGEPYQAITAENRFDSVELVRSLEQRAEDVLMDAELEDDIESLEGMGDE